MDDTAVYVYKPNAQCKVFDKVQAHPNHVDISKDQEKMLDSDSRDEQPDEIKQFTADRIPFFYNKRHTFLLRKWKSMPLLQKEPADVGLNQDASFKVSLSMFPATTNIKSAVCKSDDGDDDISRSTQNQTRPMHCLLILSIGWMFIFMAFYSVRSMQSSLNHDQGLGLVSLSCFYGGYLLACVFTTGIVKMVGPKRTIIISLIFQIIYIGANIYPKIYTLVPTSLVAGATQSAMWTAQSTFLIRLVEIRCANSDEAISIIVSQFFGIFVFFSALAPMFGSILTSVLLSRQHISETILGTIDKSRTNKSINYNSSTHGIVYNNISTGQSATNISEYIRHDFNLLCGAEFCQQSHSRPSELFYVASSTRYILIACYLICMVVALVLFMVWLDGNVGRQQSSSCLKQNETNRFVEHIACFVNILKRRDMHLMIPVVFYVGFQTAFYTGEIITSFISCPYGIHMVGYAMASFSACAALSAYLSGMAALHLGQMPIFAFGGVLNLCSLVAMFLYGPVPSNPVPGFVLVCFWGVGDGIWITQANALIGTLFYNQAEASYSSYQVFVALGLTLGYSYANHCCMLPKVIITGCACILAMSSVICLHNLKRREKKYSSEVSVIHDHMSEDS